MSDDTIIHKESSDLKVTPNLDDYDEARKAFPLTAHRIPLPHGCGPMRPVTAISGDFRPFHQSIWCVKIAAEGKWGAGNDQSHCG